MSQCSTSAQCLKELARVMEQFGIDNILDVVNSKYVIYRCTWDIRAVPNFNVPSDWSFAIAEVEGKPVFVGDTIYLVRTGGKQVVGEYTCIYGEEWSWNPPKPKTIMVELLVEDAESFARLANFSNMGERINKACRQALEREGVK